MPSSEVTQEVVPHFRPYKISAVGQMTLPANLRRQWDVIDGGHVEVASFDEGVLVLPIGSSVRLLTRAFPYIVPNTRPSKSEQVAQLQAWVDGDRTNGARFTSVTDDVAPAGDTSIKRIQGITKALKPYMVSAVGQFSMPAETRRAWNVLDGGQVGVSDYGAFALVTPNAETPLTSQQTRDLVPLDTLLELGAEPDTSASVYGKDLQGYTEWCNRLGSAVIGMAQTFIEAETALGRSQFGAHLIEAAVRDVMEAAHRQAQQ